MISKESFVRAIDTIIKHKGREEKFIAALCELSPETYNDCFLFTDYESELIKILEEDMNDEDRVIMYFLYELEAGKDKHAKDALLIDGVSVDLSSAEKVYDYLTK